jgi:two-component system LytT family response regulator
MTPSPPDGLRVLVADDERPARERLIDLLHNDPDVRDVIEAENGLAAVDCIRDARPDLVFLDVQMPELDGLGVIEAVGPTAMPLTIFVTAYDQHAVRAFEGNALDYLLKPYSDERQDAAMARAKQRLSERSAFEFGQRMLRLVGTRSSTCGASSACPSRLRREMVLRENVANASETRVL